MNNQHHIGIFELQERIKGHLEDSFMEMLWLCGEIAQINRNSSGHCYITLIERNQDGKTIAKLDAIIWATRFRVLQPFFRSVAGEDMQEGMKILVQVRLNYSQLYGLSLIINDIDPAYSVGTAIVERERIIARLKEEGMLELNSALELKAIPKRIAVISSSTAAGYGDFMDHLHNNSFGYRFVTELFPAPMQGADAPGGIIEAMDRVAMQSELFDVAVILRGGGSATDLACFDDYELALNIAQFPLPVLTAIGHDRDLHVADVVAYKGVKTPTALADFFIDLHAAEEAMIDSLADRIMMAIKMKEREAIHALDIIKMRISVATANKIALQRQRLDQLQYRIEQLNPYSTLERGFAVPLKNGKRINTVSALAIDDALSLLLADGIAECKVTGFKKQK
ncbi:MAG: exodeoxyribonuclease VII large subunit [Bacteroidales bacterium]|nr:exodeoxyribonuclease VII large subunit [Bacteroidales bacterium]